MTKKINTREIALNILMEVFEKGKLSHISLRDNLDKYSELTKQDRAFITRLAEGTIEKAIQLDYIINCYSKVKVKKMKPAIRNIIRMGVYQIKYMDSVPDSAACNESVRLAVLKGYSGLKGFVNGVLRSYIREPDKGNFSEDNYSVKYSVPQWIIDMWIQSYGQETTLKMLDNAVCDEGITIRQNKSVCSREELIKSLTDDGVDVKESDITPGVFYIKNVDNPAKLKSMQNGMFQIQDMSSVIAGMALSPEKDRACIDVCAAPGGKTIHAADMLCNTGTVYSRDLTDGKVKMIDENVKRSGFTNVITKVWDAAEYDEEMYEKADYLIADLPCSGLGVISKKTDIKYKTKPEDIDSLVEIQRQILSTVSKYVKPGGVMVFSTCTVNLKENNENVRWIIENLPFEPESLKGKVPEKLSYESENDGYMQIFNGDYGMDGFFVARFRKK